MRLKHLFVQGETRSSAFSLLHCVALEGLETLFSSRKTNDFETAHLQKQETLSALASSCGPNGARITPELLVSLPAGVVAAALACFAVPFEVRIRGAAWRGATGSDPIPTAILAMSGRGFQIVWPRA
jgi:hypothetical protein